MIRVGARQLLSPLPSLRASIGRLVARKVDRLSCVRFASARYSVPTRLIGTQVGIHTEDGQLLIVVPATGELVAEHTLVAPGEASRARMPASVAPCNIDREGP